MKKIENGYFTINLIVAKLINIKKNCMSSKIKLVAFKTLISQNYINTPTKM